MGSQGGGGGNGVGATQAQEPKTNALARQGSLYSLTLDEVQNQLGDLGKPLSSMNLDELLKTVWTVEASQGMGGGTDYEAHGQVASGSSLLPGDLSKKTVDQVWQDIQQGRKRDNNNNNNIDNRKAHGERQITLGEMTLEDFLVKAGVVAESTPGKKSSGSGSVLGVDTMAMPQQNVQQQAQWSQYQIQPMHQLPPVFMPGHPVPQPLTIVPNPTIDATYPESQMAMSPTALMGTLSDTQTLGRKRVAPGDVVEKTVERRQKRMIKNRESAARSRARKQAYTHELENKVSRLEEENERLKRQKEIEKVLPSVPPPEPKYQLRRTSSAPF
ncbi:ABSCISIC ACID-INSENSITIVE 5-like protein 2 [Lycium ferocissimum]|uniref:ABSCISIC ACID-INSENSITIVE 5-like protein 2 n=1 Tax=Lycium ferocissimum TaxID=112874 RepID=UPI002815345B|nr:ABSCISIC ACID-INSENSITIVE 5-like protein 2 [Lycium ferocissimum]